MKMEKLNAHLRADPLWEDSNVKPYLVKGRHVMVVGRLKLNKWETDEGMKRSKLSVVAEKVNLTPNGSSSSESRKPVAAGVGDEEDAPF